MQDAQEKIITMDTRITNVEQKFKQIEDRLMEQEKQLKLNINALDEQENRNRRNNTGIRGLSEVAHSRDLSVTLQNIFSELLQESNDTAIDRAHRITGPRKVDESKPRGVICRMHYAQTKDKTMIAVRQQKNIRYERTQFNVFPGSIEIHRRRALKPLLEQLVKKNFPYR